MTIDLPPSALRVQAALDKLGLPFVVVAVPATTRTAQDAAHAIGCTVGQIAKSILFRGVTTGKPVLVVASGTNRVNERSLATCTGEPLEKATPDFVRLRTGYAIGGVPPLGFPEPIETWLDRDLLQYEVVWAAAGTPFTVFSLDPASLPLVTGGAVVKVV